MIYECSVDRSDKKKSTFAKIPLGTFFVESDWDYVYIKANAKQAFSLMNEEIECMPLTAFKGTEEIFIIKEAKFAFKL